MNIRLWIATALILTSASADALVTEDRSESCVFGHCWIISQSITRDDARTVAAIAQRMATEKVESPEFRLDSTGGDVESAIRIGRLFRKMSARAFVKRCLSSCVLIYAGAVHRISASANIGIHRPYPVITEPRMYNDIQQDQRRLNSLVKAFLEEMNISPRLLDAMNAVPSEQIRMLSEAEQEEFGLGVLDSVLQEQQNAGYAREYGLSMQEFIRRKSLVKTRCGLPFLPGSYFVESYLSCREGVMHGSR